jgi:hypothetical protein
MGARFIRLTNTSSFSSPSPDPSGIVYLNGSNTLLISDAEVELTPVFVGNNTFETNLDGSPVRFGNVFNFSSEPTGLAYNPADRSLFISDDANGSRRITQIKAGTDNIFGTSDDTLVKRIPASVFNRVDSEDVTFDTRSGHLFIAGGLNDSIVEITGSGTSTLVNSFNTSNFGLLDPEGISANPESDNLFIVGQPADFVFEVTKTGSLVQKIYIGNVDPLKPAGITVAPTSNNTSGRSLYIVDRGIDEAVDPNENDGKLYEFALETSLYVTSKQTVNLKGQVFENEDVAAYNPRTGQWTKYIDGSDLGLAANDLDAVHVNDDGSVLFSLSTDVNLDGFGFVDDADVIRFVPTSTGETTAGSFERYFDGSDVGLNVNTEDVDALSIDANGDILISTNGSYSVTGVAGTDDDILRFDPTSLGENTAGIFSLYFDGSDVGLNDSETEDVKGVSVLDNGEVVISTQGDFQVSGLNGSGGDLLSFNPNSLGDNTSGSFSQFSDADGNGFNTQAIADFSVV